MTRGMKVPDTVKVSRAQLADLWINWNRSKKCPTTNKHLVIFSMNVQQKQQDSFCDRSGHTLFM